MILSCILIPLLEKAALPAAPMLGCLAAAIVVAAADGTVRVPGSALFAAEALIGCLIARAFKLPMLAEILRDWPLFLGAVVSVFAASSALGWLLMRWQVLPGTAAIWGSFPGASTVMTLMAEAYGEDVRLVAFMQYLRVALIAVVASLVARVFMGSGGAVLHIVWFPPVDWGWCSVTVAGVDWDEFCHAVGTGKQPVSPWCAMQLRELAALGSRPLDWDPADAADLPPAVLG